VLLGKEAFEIKPVFVLGVKVLVTYTLTSFPVLAYSKIYIHRYIMANSECKRDGQKTKPPTAVSCNLWLVSVGRFSSFALELAITYGSE